MDECSLNKGGCSEFATCTNVPGSFVCTCITGYTGDGFTCTGKNLVTCTPVDAIKFDKMLRWSTLSPCYLYEDQSSTIRYAALSYSHCQWNRAGNYLQPLYLWPPCVADAEIIFSSCGFFYLLLYGRPM